MKDIEKQDIIDKYIRGEMTADEEKTFEAQLSKDKQMAKNLALDEMICKGLKDLAEEEELKANMAIWKEKYKDVCYEEPFAEAVGSENCHMACCPPMPAQAHNGRKKKTWFLTSFLAAAACIAIAVVISMPASQAPLLQYEQSYSRAGSKGVNYAKINAVAALEDSHEFQQALDSADRYINLINGYKIEAEDLPEGKCAATMNILNDMEYQLTALKINALIGMGKYDKAMNLIEDFVKIDGQYKKDAEKTYKTLKKSK